MPSMIWYAWAELGEPGVVGKRSHKGPFNLGTGSVTAKLRDVRMYVLRKTVHKYGLSA